MTTPKDLETAEQSLDYYRSYRETAVLDDDGIAVLGLELIRDLIYLIEQRSTLSANTCLEMLGMVFQNRDQRPPDGSLH